MGLLNIISENKLETDNQTIRFWHGGNLDEIYDDVQSRKGRTVFGIGLYLTTQYEVGKKYAKGNRKLYMVDIAKGNNLNYTKKTIPIQTIKEFISSICSKAVAKDFFGKIEYYQSKRPNITDMNIQIFNNMCLNYEIIKPKYSNDYRKFLVKHGVDYELSTSTTFNGYLMVLFNFNKISKVKRMVMKDVDELDSIDFDKQQGLD